MLRPLAAAAFLLIAVALPLLVSLPGCEPTLQNDDDDATASDDDDSTPFALCPDEEDAQEENDSFGAATQTTASYTADGVSCPGDSDWYRIDVPNCDEYEVSVPGAELADLEVWLRDDAGDAISSTPITVASGELGYSISGPTWTEPWDDDDTPPGPRTRYVEVFNEGTDGGLRYSVSVASVPNYNCDE